MKKPTRILIVEDVAADADLAQRTIRKVLKNCKFQVVETHKDFLQALEAFQPDVILSDYHLPNFDGMKALKLALNHAPLSPFIIWTGSISEDVAVGCMKAGANNYVLKENIKRLGAAVIHALEERQLMLERKQAEERIKERERQLTLLFSNLPGPVYRCRNDADYTMEFVSDNITELSGYQVEDFRQHRRHFGRMIHSEDRERVWGEIQVAVEKNQPFELTYRILTANNEEKWVWEKGQGILDAEGQLNTLEGFITDITERKQAEEALQNSEKRFRALIENGLDDISLLAADGTLLWESPSTVRNLGYAPGEFLLRNIFDLIHPDDLAWTRNLYAKLMQEPGGRQNGTFRLRRSDGTWRWVEAIVTNMLNEPGVNAIVANYRDVTERKQAEIELQQRNDDLALINTLNEVVNRGEGLNAVVHLMAKEVKRIFSGEGTTIYSLNPDGQSIRMQQYFLAPEIARKIEKMIGGPIPAIEIPIQENGYFQSVLRSGRGTITSDPQAIQKWIGEFVETTSLPPIARGAIRKLIPQIYKLLNIRSTILIPLVSDGKPIGLLDISSPKVFTAEDLRRIENIAGQLTTAFQRKQVDDVLKEERNLLRTLIDNLPDRIYVMDTEGRKTLSNTADWKASGGKTMEDVIGKTDFDMYPPELAEPFWQLDRAVIDSGQPVINYEEPGLDAEGNRVSILTTKMPLRDAEGKVTGLVGIGRDITERKQADEALRASEARFRTFVNHATDAFFLHDDQGTILDVNRQACESLGCTREELIGLTPFDFDPDLVPSVFEQMMTRLVTGEMVAFDTHHRRRDGSIFPVEIRIRPFQEGGRRFAVSLVRDITERKQVEAHINDLLAFNEKILNHSPIGILTFKLTGECVFANENAASIVGTQVEQLQAQNFHTIEAWKTSGLYDLAEKAIATQAPVTADIHHVSTFGKDIWMTAHCVTFKSKEEDHLLLSISDISERKRAEEALRESENRLVMALSGAQMSVWEWNLQSNHILWSPEFFEITGIQENDFGNTFESFTHLIHKDDVTRVMAAAEKAMTERTLFAEEFRIVRPSGEIRWLSNLGHAEYDPTEDYLRLLGTVQDITQRKQAEIERQALLEITQGLTKTDELQEFLKLVHHSIARVIYAENFFITLYQPNSGMFEEIYFVDQFDAPTPPAKLEKSITSYIFRSGEPLLLTQVLFDELAAQGEVELVGTNSASWLGVPLKTSGRTIGVMAVQDYENDNRYSERDRDFLASIATQVALSIEHRAAGIALRESEEHYRAIFEGVQDAIFVESLDGKILTVNERACEMFGYSHAEFLTKTIADLVPEGHPILMTDGTDEANSFLSAEPRETVNQRANGEIFPIEISGRLQVINGETVVLVVVRDITERKEAEEELKRSHSLLYATLESTADGILVAEPNGRISNFNQKFLELFQIPDELAAQKDDRALMEFVLNQVKDPFAFISRVEALYQSPETTSFDELEFWDGRIFERFSQPQRLGNAVVGRVWSFRDITKRKRAEAALRVENERFLRFIESNIVGIVIADAAGNITLANDYYLRILGVTRQDFLAGRVQWTKFTPAEWLPADEKAIRELRERGICEPYEKEYERLDGSRVPVYIADAMLPGPGDQIAAFVLDITERKQADESLRAEREKVQNYLDIAGVMMLALDQNGTVTLINQKGCEILGYSADEIIGKDWIRTFLPKTVREELQEVFQWLISGDNQSVAYIENAVLTRTGEERLIAWHNTVVRDTKGTIVNTLSSGEDITDRKRAEGALRKSEERYRSLFENMIDGYAHCQILFENGQPQDFVYLDVNPAFETLTGLKGVVGKKVSDIIPNIRESNPELLEIYGRVASTGQPEQFETYLPNLRSGTSFAISVYSPEKDHFVAVVENITERKQAESALMESMAQFRTLFEASPEAIMLLDPSDNWSIIDCNPAACQMNGYHREELIGQCIDILNLVPGDPNERAEYMKSVRQHGILRYETVHRRKDGTLITVEISSSLIQFGKRDLVLGIDRDITERKQAEELLRESEERFSSAFEYASIGMALLTPEGQWFRVNRALCELVGYSEAELLKTNFQNMTHPDDLEGDLNYVRQLLAGEINSYQLEKRYFHKLGHVIWVLLSVSLVQDHEGNPLYFVSQIQDITERKHAEAELRASEERFRQLADHIQEVFWMTDVESGREIYVSPAAETIWGRSIDSLMNEPDAFIKSIFPEDRPILLDAIEKEKNGEKAEIEYRIVRPNGELRWVWDRAFPIFDDSGSVKRIAGISADITERRESELALIKSQSRYRELFDSSPISLWEEDFSRVKERIDILLKSGISDLSEHLSNHPEQVIELASLVKITDVNQASLELYHLERKEDLLKNLTEVLGRETIGHFQEEILGLLSPVKRFTWEGTEKDFDGAQIELVVNGSIPDGYEEDWSKVIVSISDITERKQAEQALLRREQQLEEAQRLGHIGSWEWDIQTNTTTWTNEMYRLYDRDPQLPPFNFEEFVTHIHPDDQQRIMQILQQTFQTHLPCSFDYRITIAEGKIRWLHGRGEMVMDDTGQPVRMQGIAQNITEHREAEQQLRKLSQAVEQSTSVIMITDTAGNIEYVNPKFTETTGYSREEVIGRNPRILKSGFTSNKDYKRLWKAIKSGQEWQGELWNRKKNGELFWEHATISPISNDRGEITNFLGVKEDITQRKQSEIETRRHVAELEALYENGLAVSRLLKPSEVGDRVIETFARYLPWHHVAIRLRREESDELELVAFSVPDLKEEERDQTRQHFIARINKVGQGLSGWVIQTGVPLRTGDVHAHPQYVDTHAEIQSGLYMPLKIGERVIGVISVESEASNAFTEQDERLLATLASQATVAFENARLYEAIQRELSERKRAEEALRSSETHYRELADSITDILFELDQDLRYTHWNKASEALMGVPVTEAIGKSMHEIFGTSEEQTRIRKIYEGVLENREPKTFETTLVLYGEKRSFEISVYPSTRGVSVVAKDVTDRKKSESIMQKRFELMEYSAHHTLSEVMQRTTDEVSELTGSTIGFFHFVEADQTSLGTQTWSTSALQLFNVPINEGAHLPLDQAGVWAEAVRQRRPLIQNDYGALSEKKGLPQGHVPMLREIVIPILRNERIMAVMGVGNKPQNYTDYDLEIAVRLADYAWDITERKQMETALAEERNQLAQHVEERTADLSRANSNLARALRVKDEFLANMSHELRTPLNAILGLSESLGEQIAGPLNEKQQKYIGTIGESGHHLLSLINDILDLAKIEAGQITLDINKMDIHSVCQASLRMIKQLAQKKNQEVVLEIDDGLGLMWADERRLKQMIVNLLGNAVKFTPENGKIGLKVNGDQGANKITITVEDNGIGIKEDDLARLFQPFIQLDSGLARETTGTGLGLALVAQMARLHGGSVSASSEPGKGSRFSIVLPWEPALALDTAARLRITGKFRAIKVDETHKPIILLVEDTQEVTMMVRDYLELAGYKVVTAQDGVDAIVQAKLFHPNLILMDVQMPRMDGLEATRKLRSDPDFRYIPIIALTALAMPSDRVRCLEAGMDEYISKPVNLRALVKIIQGCLNNGEESQP